MRSHTLTSRLERTLWRATDATGLITTARASIRRVPATETLGRMLVSGPTFGRKTSPVTGCRALDETVEVLARRGLLGAFHLSAFLQQADQIAIRAGEEHSGRKKLQAAEGSFCRTMTKFYRGVVDSGLVGAFAFTHNWQHGPDCWWLRTLVSAARLPIIDLPIDIDRWSHELTLNLTLVTA